MATVLVALLVFGLADAKAQDRKWILDLTGGYTGKVDSSTERFLTVGGSARRNLTPRLSVGPEFVLMLRAAFCASESSPNSLSECGGGPDRKVMMTANVVFDVLRASGNDARRVIPFLVGGGGIVWMRDEAGDGRFWSNEPAFTVGGGLRARVSQTISAGAEYRFGSELHHRMTGLIGIRW